MVLFQLSAMPRLLFFMFWPRPRSLFTLSGRPTVSEWFLYNRVYRRLLQSDNLRRYLLSEVCIGLHVQILPPLELLSLC